MKIRCDLHVNGGSRKLLLVGGPNETGEHIALRLAAYLLFWDEQPVMEANAKHPALANQIFLPDLMALDEAGEIKLWVECGSTTMNKMTKLTRKLPAARILVMKATEREAVQLRKELKDQLDREDKIEVIAWPGTSFKEWLAALAERTEVYGEGGGLMINGVVNERPIVAEFKRF